MSEGTPTISAAEFQPESLSPALLRTRQHHRFEC
jgi:hypothetical protein